MMEALKECESVNGENAELTSNINEEIEKVEQTLSQYSWGSVEIKLMIVRFEFVIYKN